MDHETSEICADRGAGGRCFRIRGDAFVELADAGSVWIDNDWILAGVGAVAAQQDSVWQVSGSRTGNSLEAPHDGALGTNDAGRTREIPRRNARPLRAVSFRISGGE